MKILAWFTGVMLLLIIGGYFALRSPVVQTWLTHRIAAYLSGQLNTRVEVGGVDIEFIKKVVLERVYIEDLHHDTLLYASAIKANISKFDSDSGRLILSSASLNGAKIFLKKYKNEDGLNFQFIIDAFAAEESDTTPAKPFTLECASFRLEETVFSYLDTRYAPNEKGVDFTALEMSSINTLIENIKVDGDSVTARIEQLSLHEDRGNFDLKKLSADAVFAPGKMAYNGLAVQTPYSDIRTDITFFYDSFDDFSSFIEKIKFRSKFSESKISFMDISKFAPQIEGMDQLVTLSGEIRGTVENLKSKNLYLSFGRETVIKGKANLTGLPDIDETVMDLSLDELRTTKEDMELIPIPPFDKKEHLVLPDNIGSLGTIRYKGKFTGFYDDFVAYGNFNTALGNFFSDIHLKYDLNKNTSEYTGHVRTEQFDIGKFLSQQQTVGKISADARLNGKGLTMNKLASEVEGTISSLTFNGYDYKNINVHGNVRKGLFTGDLAIADENLKMGFEGTVDFTGKVPVFDFSSEIRNANLNKLHFIQRDSSSSLSTNLQMHFSGNTLDNMDGEIIASGTSYSEGTKNLVLDRMVLISSVLGKNRTITVKSDAADLSLSGEFYAATFVSSVQEVLSALLPSYFPPVPLAKSRKSKQEDPPVQSVDFEMNLKRTHPVTNIFIPGLVIASGTTIKGTYNSSKHFLHLTGSSPEIEFSGTRTRELLLSAHAENDRFTFEADGSRLFVNDSTWIDDLNISASAQRDSMNFSIQLQKGRGFPNEADLSGIVFFRTGKNILLKIHPSTIKAENVLWQVNEDNSIVFDSSSIELNNFVFTSGTQKVALLGTFSSSSNQQVQLAFSNFNISNLKRLMDLYDIEAEGTINGKANVIGNFEELGSMSTLTINGLKINGDSLGAASIIASWDTRSRILAMTGGITKGTVKTIEFKGIADTRKDKEELNFDITVQKIYLQMFKNYLKDIVSELYGLASAELHLSGKPSDPVLEGKLRLQKTSFVIDYLNTAYNFSHEFTVTKNAILLDGLVLNEDTDLKNRRLGKNSQINTVAVAGKVTHTQFRDFKFDVRLKTKNMKCLNTASHQNSLFYGEGYVSGNVRISGTPSNISFDAAVKTEKGTQLFIPLSNPVDVTQSGGFINFIKKDTLGKSAAKPVSDLSGIQLDFDLEMTPDADVQLIFDEKIGDVIKGRGTGNIKMDINTAGHFGMFGEFVIEDGDYLFTLQNIINKRFKIEKGGTIRWAGDPYDAEIALNAIYTTRAALYDLLQDTTYKKRIPIDCRLMMTNRLMNPTIRFDLNIPNLDDGTSNQVKRFINTEQEMSRQVFSLLVMNRFSTPPQLSNNLQASGNAVGANASELLSNQLTNWASQLSKAVDIGINYRAADAISQKELEVSLSKQLFNDRVTIDGNVGVTSDQNNASNLVGDFNVDVKVSNDGKFRVKGFNKSNSNQLINNNTYTQGVGLFYREEFDTFREFFIRLRKGKKKKEEGSKEIGK